MAKREVKGAAAAVAEQPQTETVAAAEQTGLQKAGPSGVPSASMAVLEGVDRADKRGTEGINAKDMILPRLALCQSNSPQRKRGNEKFIAGLDEGMMFNSLTGDIYEAPLDIIPIKLDKRAMQFRPMEEGGGIVDRNVPFDDPRCDYTTDKDGEDVKPVATRFYDWLCYLPSTGELIVASFKGTSEKAGKKIATLTSFRPGPTFGQLYRLETAAKHENNYDWHVFTVVPAGAPQVGDALIAEAAYEQFKNKAAKFDEEIVAEPAAGAGDGTANVVDGTVASEL